MCFEYIKIFFLKSTLKRKILEDFGDPKKISADPQFENRCLKTLNKLALTDNA